MVRPSVSGEEVAWVASVGRPTHALRDEIVAALRAHGLRAERSTTTSHGPGIVAFDEVTPELCRLVRERSGRGLECLIAVASSPGALGDDAVWQVLDAGAADAFAWDPETGPNAVAERLDRRRRIDALMQSPEVREELVGESPGWRAVLRQVVEIARFTDAPVLVTGESGTGKELIARVIHDLDARPRKRELVVLDCTTIVPSLSGSEFFGHERGAFTGADTPREGAFALADGGTLFLDEVGELPLTLQAELLRVVQEGTYKRVGSNTWRETRFRLVCATNKDLLAEAAAERFRRDFYYRIAAWRIDLPTLRERRDDVVPLTKFFLRRLRPNGEACELDGPVLDFLLRRDYPGNVRDLRHLVTRMSHRHVGAGPMTLGDIPEDERPHVGGVDWRDDGFERSIRTALMLGTGLKEITSAAAETAIRIAIGEEGGNLQRASSRLGVTARALQLRRAAAQRDGHPTGN